MFEGLPREANFARVDNMTSLPIFKSIYAHSPLVCGAFPSLHTAFPALIAFGRKPWFTRSFCWLHVVWIGCAAVYSLHHWIIDVAFGVLFAWAACQLSNFVINRCIVSQIRGYPDPRLIRHYQNKNGIYANVV
jgi:membrane-associated phospholipid phosphatase